MATQPTLEQMRAQAALLAQQMKHLEEQEEAARQAALLQDGQSAQAANARAEQAEQLAAARQTEIEALTARVLSLEQEIARLQQANTANTAQVSEHESLLAENQSLGGIVSEVATEMAETAEALTQLLRNGQELMRNSQVLALKYNAQHIRLQPVVATYQRQAATSIAAPQHTGQRKQLDTSAARTAGSQHSPPAAAAHTFPLLQPAQHSRHSPSTCSLAYTYTNSRRAPSAPSARQPHSRWSHPPARGGRLLWRLCPHSAALHFLLPACRAPSPRRPGLQAHQARSVCSLSRCAQAKHLLYFDTVK